MPTLLVLRTLIYGLALSCVLAVMPFKSWAEEEPMDSRERTWYWHNQGEGMHINYYESAHGDNSLTRIGMHDPFEYGSFIEFSALIMAEKSDIRYAGIDLSFYWHIPSVVISPYFGYGLQLGLTDEEIRPVVGASIDAGIISLVGDNVEILLSIRFLETTEHELNSVLYGAGLAFHF